MKSIAIFAVAFGALVGCADADTMVAPEPELATTAAAMAAGVRPAPSYDVTVRNLTSAGQWFTPPLVAIHRGAVKFFKEGKPASVGIQQIAENGNLTPMMDGLSESMDVSDFMIAPGGAGPLAPGEAVTVSLSGGPGFNFVSLVSMLICTNDGFTGVSGRKLPKEVGGEATFYLGAYDAGTEMNTEDFTDLVPPCQVLGGVSSGDEGTGESNPALAEGGVVRHHGGIIGGNDLTPEAHGWTDPVAMVTVRRTG
jgi:hypothetical protein